MIKDFERKKLINILYSMSEDNNLVFNKSDFLSYCNKNFSIDNYQLIDDYLRELKSLNLIGTIKKGLFYIKSFENGDNISISYLKILKKIKDEFAIGFLSAARHHNLTEQLSNTYFLQIPGRNYTLEKQYLIYNFYFVGVKNKQNYFGFTNIWVEDEKAKVTDLEKTILDCFHKPQFSGGFIECAKMLSIAIKNLDIDKLIEYSTKIGNTAPLKRIGYVLEVFQKKSFVNKIRSQYFSKKYSKLAPDINLKGRYNREWRLLLNVDKEEILTVLNE